MRHFSLFSTHIQQQNYANFIKAKLSKQKEIILTLCKLKQSASDWNRLLHSYGSLNELIEEIFPELSALIMRKQSCEFDLLDIAFATGNNEMIQRILISLRIVLNKDLVKKAILCNNTASVILLENWGMPLTDELMIYAAENGCLNILKHCVSQGLIPTKDTLDDAALYGDLPTIRYLINELHIQPNIRTLDYTIIGSNIRPHGNRAATKYLFDLISQKAEKTEIVRCIR